MPGLVPRRTDPACSRSSPLRSSVCSTFFSLMICRASRDNLYMLITLSELSFHDVRVISVADGLDSADPRSKLVTQFRGIINELALSDLSDRTRRGQHGQKERGYTVGERTYGYRSVEAGQVRIDKHGRPRPDGYKQKVDPLQAAIVVRIFEEFVSGVSIARIVQSLNKDAVPTVVPHALGWGLSTVSRILRREKYIGRWTWNRTGTRPDPRTGRRHKFTKPDSEHRVDVDESLRIVSPALWAAARLRSQEVAGAWPGGSGRGYSAAQGPRSEVYPTHLLDGMLYCAQCSKRVGLVSGRHGGYYGCHSARRCLCDNRLTVCRSLVERVFLAALRARLLEPGVVRYALGRVAAEVARLSGDVADLRRAKQAELAEARRRLERILEFIATGQGAGSDALGAQLVVAERRVTQLDVELAALQGRDGPVLAVPSEEWVVERVTALQQVLERRTVKSALVLRRLLGKVVLDAVRSDSGRSHYVARTQIDTFVLVEPPGPRGGPDGGSRPLQWWRRWVLHLGPHRVWEAVARCASFHRRPRTRRRLGHDDLAGHRPRGRRGRGRRDRGYLRRPSSGGRHRRGKPPHRAPPRRDTRRGPGTSCCASRPAASPSRRPRRRSCCPS